MGELEHRYGTDLKTPTSVSEVGTSDLLPCPFCGSDAFIWPAMIIRGYRVSCRKDCVSMPSRPDMAFNSEDQAKSAWNKRAR
jgi:hypothetical protein